MKLTPDPREADSLFLYYKAELPTLFAYNALLVASDGVEARIGTLTAGREWFKPWRTVSGETLAESYLPELQVMVDGVFDRPRFLDLIGSFLVFEETLRFIVRELVRTVRANVTID